MERRKPRQVRLCMNADMQTKWERVMKLFPDLSETQVHGFIMGAALRALDESDPDWVHVPAAKAKTRQRRLVAIRPALLAWLDLGGTLPCRTMEQETCALVSSLGIPWPRNAARHSWCSYHLAAFGSAANTALEAGHSEAMLFRHYRALVTPEAAAAFWAIRPT